MSWSIPMLIKESYNISVNNKTYMVLVSKRFDKEVNKTIKKQKRCKLFYELLDTVKVILPRVLDSGFSSAQSRDIVRLAGITGDDPSIRCYKIRKIVLLSKDCSGLSKLQNKMRLEFFIDLGNSIVTLADFHYHGTKHRDNHDINFLRELYAYYLGYLKTII